MCRPNFRVKLDLCKFYNDVRRLCWIFVDGTKMLEIGHMKEHITKLFGIREPFHLLLNEIEYLPANEDIRLLKENETIVVSPGSGLETETELSASTVESLKSRDNFVKAVKSVNHVEHKESQTNLHLVQPETTSVETFSNGTTSRIQSDVSEASTALHIAEDNETESITESKATDTNSLPASDIFNISDNSIPCSKRRRVRHKRKKIPEVQRMTSLEEENKLKKPKIVNTYVIPTGKHIRFDKVEDSLDQQSTHEGTMNGSCTEKVQPPHELANLLSLSQNSTPITFTNPRMKKKMKVEHAFDEETRLNTSSETLNEDAATDKKVEEEKQFLTEHLESLPILTEKPRLKDVIAFKMLKIGPDYTPQVSEFIVAEVISCNPNDSVYTFKVLQGVSEVQVPIGKFTITEDEEERLMNDTITLNHAQIMEPRLVPNSDLDTANNLQ